MNKRQIILGFGGLAALLAARQLTPGFGDEREASAATLADSPPPPVAAAAPEHLTEKFKNLRGQLPWLDDARKCVGQADIHTGTSHLGGSAVLLDDQGTIALCGHLVERNPVVTLRFPIGDGDGWTERMPLELLSQNAHQDIAFARIPVEMIAKYGLKPVVWADHTPMGGDSVLTGYPGGDDLLDVELGNDIHNAPDYRMREPDGHIAAMAVTCNTEANGPSKAGESGGALFNKEAGHFIGIQKAGSEEAAPGALPQPVTTTFVKVESLWAAYVAQFPAQSARATLATVAPQRDSDQSCVVTKRSFLRLRPL